MAFTHNVGARPCRVPHTVADVRQQTALCLDDFADARLEAVDRRIRNVTISTLLFQPTVFGQASTSRAARCDSVNVLPLPALPPHPACRRDS